MSDIQVTISDNNASVDLNFAQSVAAAVAVHNTDTQSHANILSAITTLNSQVATKAASSSIPTKVSQLQNDSSFATTSQIPTVPTLISAFTNDASYATTSQLTSKASTTLNNITQSSALTNLGFLGQSLTTNGYYKFPNGFVLQWGISGALAASTNVAVTLPMNFANSPLCAISVPYASTLSSQSAISVISITTSTLTIRNCNPSSSISGAYWMAIGY